MAPVQNSSVIYNSIPTGYPIVGETLVVKSEMIDLDNVPLPAGGALLKILSISVDPYLRVRMRDPDIPS